MTDGPGAHGASQAVHSTVPAHVAIIMDGNGRWANGRGKNRSDGHRAGTENIRRIINAFTAHGVKYLTLYAFSTENWGRPGEEVDALMELLGEAIRSETHVLHEQGVRIRHVGRVDRLSQHLQKAIAESVELTKYNTVMNLNVAFDYGGRAELLDAIKKMLADGVRPEAVNTELLERYLYTAGIPDPDLIIRTAGEMRLSNFLIWQAAYAEYYSTTTLWPDFDETEVERALSAYAQRQRRFGRVLAPQG
ncbi:MAG: di-trans,poly-cis-decaprenylcistransferase [SAR202 cluster bacterium]|nr:di-trans,poly-cis-decaprenylcistransferase [SAR202 cluster bacterium]